MLTQAHEQPLFSIIGRSPPWARVGKKAAVPQMGLRKYGTLHVLQTSFKGSFVAA